MGYSEQVCQICGISFNIGRIRTRGEAQDAGWASYGSDYVVDDNPSQPCKAEGCENNQREDRAEDAEKEHVAGVACTCTQGYSGHRISVDELRDITACICLQPKTDAWRPESDDEDFERDAVTCFLTGVSKNGIDEFEVRDLTPARHDIGRTMIENWFLDEGPETFQEMDEGAGQAMPMHPKCFEVFKRASMGKFGKVDIDGLYLLKDMFAYQSMPDDDFLTRFKSFPQGTDLGIVLDQWYFHEPGTEYLAANPFDVPGLQALLEKCRGPHPDVVFEVREIGNASDIFATLSTELRSMLLEALDVQDVANLRLVSPSFSQLEQSYFRSLILSKMPWIWVLRDPGEEAKDMDWYKLWLALIAADGGSQKDEEERWWLKKIRDEAFQRLQQVQEAKGLTWGMPEFQEPFRLRGPNFDQQCEMEVEEGYASGRWPGKKATEINGLRNRRRVWMDCEEILRRIENKHERGLDERFGSFPEESM